MSSHSDIVAFVLATEFVDCFIRTLLFYLDYMLFVSGVCKIHFSWRDVGDIPSAVSLCLFAHNIIYPQVNIRHTSNHFYRTTRMHSADYAVARCLSVHPSVCLSVTRKY